MKFQVGTLFEKPIRVIALIAGLHTAFYGAAFITGIGGAHNTLIYIALQQWMNPVYLGFVLLAAGILYTTSVILDKKVILDWAAFVQSSTWLYIAFAYFFAEFWFLAVTIGILWSAVSGFSAACLKAKAH